MIGDEYGEKTEEFKTEFLRVKDDLNRGIGVEVFKIVHSSGELSVLAINVCAFTDNCRHM